MENTRYVRVFHSRQWSNYNITVLCGRRLIYKIERVQRKFTKRIPGLNKLLYTDRLEFLGWTTLELRRLYIDLIWCYKIIFGVAHLNSADFFVGHHYKLFRQSNHSNTRSFFFYQHVVNVWNSLPRRLMIFIRWPLLRELPN